jgi:hypothetical protein
MIITDLVQSQCSIRKQEIRKLQQKKRKIYTARILKISNGLIIGVWLIEQHLSGRRIFIRKRQKTIIRFSKI